MSELPRLNFKLTMNNKRTKPKLLGRQLHVI